MTAKVTVYGFWRLIIELLSLLLNAIADKNEFYHIPIFQNDEAKMQFCRNVIRDLLHMKKSLMTKNFDKCSQPEILYYWKYKIKQKWDGQLRKRLKFQAKADKRE